MRWKLSIGGLALLLAVAGCKERCFLTKDCYEYYQGALPELMAIDTKLGCQPVIPPVPAPPDTNNPDRQIRFLSLAEAEAIALEQGNFGTTQLIFFNIPGGQIDNATTVYSESETNAGAGVNSRVGGQQNIRVFRLDPAIVGAGIESALSKFDAVWTSSMTWTNTDRPVATATDVFQTQGQQAAIKTFDATFSTAILKALPSGGVAGITFNVPYEFTNLPAAVNPSYRPQLQFQFEQPLLQGFGVEINQIRAAHPGSVLSPGVLNTSPTAEGILITRIRFDQQRAEFERNVHIMVANVEVGYWNLYSSYWTLFAAEAGLRQSFEAYKINKARYEAGRVSIADLAQARGQYEGFRTQRLQALNNVLDKERQLRGLLALPVSDGCRLVPSDTPTIAPYQPDWCSALQDAMNLKPELVIARQDIKAAQLNLIAQKNALLPDLRFTATYDINAIGNRLDGADIQNAFRNLASDHFNDWSLGLRLNVPIGFRNAYANVRIAELALARSYETLRNAERDTQSLLSVQYRNVIFAYELVRSNRATREAFADQLRARFQEFLAGRGTLDILLEAQRFWSSALATEYQSIRDYNNAITAFEFARGTILQRNNINIAEGPLPVCAQVRAVEHLKERSDSLLLLERPTPTPLPPGCEHSPAAVPPLPTQEGASLPDLLKTAPLLSDAPALPPLPGDPHAAGQAGPTAATPTVLPPAATPPAGTPGTPPAPAVGSDFGAQRSTPGVPPDLSPPVPLNGGR